MIKGIVHKIIATAVALLLVACTANENALVSTDAPNIHINQVAFELNGPKSAIITIPMVNELKAFTFTINTIGKNETVFRGKLQKLASFDEWQAANKDQLPVNHFRADFSALHETGNFQLVLTHQGSPVLSEAFTIDEQVLFKKTTPAILGYFTGSRNDQDYNYEQDKNIRIFGTERYVDVRGGYNDAGGDRGKYLSHLSYANFLNPQQLSQVTWALGYSYQTVPHLYNELNLTAEIQDEIFWGADYLHRILDEQGYFYMTVFDQWGAKGAERVVTAYVGIEGVYTENYQSAFRQGAGSAIAALARAAMIAKATGKHGEYNAAQYLADAERAFRHLVKNNTKYCNDGKENIIDDYTALLAATELYRATQNSYYLDAARKRANNLSARLSPEGWFISNELNSDNLRPFYHAAEAGFPVVSLSQYLTIETEPSNIKQAKKVIAKNLAYQLALNNKVANPFNYARQPFKTYKNGKLSTEHQEGFFIPHANETNYWWQGESARLSSLTMAAIVGGRAVSYQRDSAFGITADLANFAQNQMDWTLGRNPYDLTMLNGFGSNNPKPYKGLSMVYGGISNGITGAKNSDDSRGIEYAPEPDWKNWRWVEQWIPHTTWFLLATTEMAR